MNARREASTPPVIPGYEQVRLLGTGGFADVFLYRQQMPQRPVAVKVLLAASLDDEARERFRNEANVMASLSHHPAIVTVYQADVARDGRPYLVMEYCSRPGLGERYRAERMGVAEVLRIGIRLASGVETAHRAGILHRDIKPANVLITDFGWPALTDFGIAATAGGAQMVGMSVPWSPPEILADEPIGDERSDVYSLAATIYSLLARRSPFEVADASNSAADLISRIEHSTLAPTGRGDVPKSLQKVFARAMAKEPVQRYHSAVALARALQQVEAELMLPMTPLDLPEVSPPSLAPRSSGGETEADQETRLRSVRTISSEATEQLAAASHRAESAEPVHEPTDGVPENWRRDVAHLEAAREDEQTTGRPVGRIVAAGVAGGALVTALVVGAVLAFDRSPSADVRPSVTPMPAVEATSVPEPTDLTATPVGDAVRFTWENPAPEDGDRYLWGVAVAGRETTLELVDSTSVTLGPAELGSNAQVCIEVSIVRADGRYSTSPGVKCVDR